MTVVDPAVRVSAAGFARDPLLMLFLCLCGMAIGLAIDSGSIPLEVLASLCLAGSGTLASGAAVHLSLLPATHAMMFGGAVLAAAITKSGRGSDGHSSTNATAARYLPEGACVAAMLAGMILGGWFGPPVAASLGIAASSSRLIAAMAVGMVAGMAVAMPLYRSRWCRDLALRSSVCR
jgi:hypothetical protein